jgi:hypothetical protein
MEDPPMHKAVFDPRRCEGFRVVEIGNAVEVQEWRGGAKPPKVTRVASTEAALDFVEKAMPEHIAWRRARVGGTGATAYVYVPTEQAQRRLGLAPGSAVVGVARSGGFHIHFEGNLYGAENLKTWEERVVCAAGRLFRRYPTVAQAYLTDLAGLVAVGVVTDSYEIQLTDTEAVRTYLSLSRSEASCQAVLVGLETRGL